MAQRKPPIDLRELQRSILEDEIREEQAARGAARPSPEAGYLRGAPPGSRGRSGPPPRGKAPARADGIREPFEGARRAAAEWDAYSPDPSGEPLRPAAAPEGPGVRLSRGEGLDIHELLKREAFASQQPACDDHFEKNRPCPSGVYGISDQYIILDTFSKLRESQVEKGEFRWNFMVQGVTGDEVVGVRDKIDTVIEIQIGGFSLPVIPEVTYTLAAPPAATPSGTNQLVLVHNNNNAAPPLNPLLPPAQYPTSIPALTPWINNPYSQTPYGNRMTIQLREAGLQSYSDRNGARHHYEFNIAYLSVAGGNPNLLSAVPISGSQWDTFIFTDPLKDVHGLTLIFRNPDIPIRFLPDCLYDVAVVSDGAAAPGPFLRFDAPNHGLLVGDRIVVEGFKSGVPVLDSYINRPEGHVVSGDPSVAPLPPSSPIPTPNSFWLDPAVSIIDLTAPPPALPQSVTVCIAKRRMRIPIRLRRVVARLTNYIAP